MFEPDTTREGIDVPARDFRDADMSGWTFDDVELIDTRFRHCTFDSAWLHWVTMDGSTLRGCDLRGLRMRYYGGAETLMVNGHNLYEAAERHGLVETVCPSHETHPEYRRLCQEWEIFWWVQQLAQMNRRRAEEILQSHAQQPIGRFSVRHRPLKGLRTEQVEELYAHIRQDWLDAGEPQQHVGRASVRRRQFLGIELVGAHFERVNFADSTFNNVDCSATFERCSFRNCMLEQSWMGHVTLEDCVLDGWRIGEVEVVSLLQ